MSERNRNIWAPWRMEYIEALSPDADENDEGCFLCQYWAEPARDRERHVLWRTDRHLVVMNRFPYTSGHLLIAPAAHTGELEDLSDDDLTGLMTLVRDAKRLLAATVKAQGYNIGMNLGRCAGAGLPDHVHIHIVPRWNGDTNFMSVLGDARVMPQSLDALYAKLAENAPRLGLAPLVAPQ